MGGYFYGAGVAAEGLSAFRGADNRAVLAVYPGIDVPYLITYTKTNAPSRTFFITHRPPPGNYLNKWTLLFPIINSIYFFFLRFCTVSHSPAAQASIFPV